MFLEQKYIIYVVLDWYTCSEIHFTNYTQNCNKTFSNQQDKEGVQTR